MDDYEYNAHVVVGRLQTTDRYDCGRPNHSASSYGSGVEWEFCCAAGAASVGARVAVAVSDVPAKVAGDT